MLKLILTLLLSSVIIVGSAFALSADKTPLPAHAIAYQARAATVLIHAHNNAVKPWWNDSVGTGFMIDPNVFITNYHVFPRYFTDDVKVTAQTYNTSREYEVEVIAADRLTDIVIFGIIGWNEFKGIEPYGILEFEENPKGIQYADITYAFGHPGRADWTFLSGIVSNPNGHPVTEIQPTTMIQTNLGIGPGMSGGPVLSETGRVIGISNQIIDVPGTNTGFAIRSDSAIEIISDLMDDDGVVHWPKIGIGMKDDPDLPYTLIEDVIEGSTADGIFLPGDQIISINDRSGARVRDVQEEIWLYNLGDVLAFEIERDGERLTKIVIIKEVITSEELNELIHVYTPTPLPLVEIAPPPSQPETDDENH